MDIDIETLCFVLVAISSFIAGRFEHGRGKVSNALLAVSALAIIGAIAGYFSKHSWEEHVDRDLSRLTADLNDSASDVRTTKRIVESTAPEFVELQRRAEQSSRETAAARKDAEKSRSLLEEARQTATVLQSRLEAIEEQNSLLSASLKNVDMQSKTTSEMVAEMQALFDDLGAKLDSVRSANRLSPEDYRRLRDEFGKGLELIQKFPSMNRSSLTRVSDMNHKLRLGDNILLWLDGEEFTCRVESHGEVCVPIVGGISVAGLSWARAQTTIRNAYDEAGPVYPNSSKTIVIDRVQTGRRVKSTASNYKVHAGDVLFIALDAGFTEDTEAEHFGLFDGAEFSVRPDGTLLLPLVGPIDVAGLTRKQIIFRLKSLELSRPSAPIFVAIR